MSFIAIQYIIEFSDNKMWNITSSSGTTSTLFEQASIEKNRILEKNDSLAGHVNTLRQRSRAKHELYELIAKERLDANAFLVVYAGVMKGKSTPNRSTTPVV